MLAVKLVIDISKVNILWLVCALQSILCVCVCVWERERERERERDGVILSNLIALDPSFL